MASGAPVYEAAPGPGGICSSYYVRPGETRRLDRRPADGGAYRFEIGGGHWIFGGDPAVLDLIEELAPTGRHQRRASARFADGTTVPYPVQDHAHRVPPGTGRHPAAEPGTMQAWLLERFGPELCRGFFFPFHQRYTAGLYDRIAPADAYKSPVGTRGYNTEFRYPIAGLDVLARRLADRCRVHYGTEVVAVDAGEGVLALAGGREQPFERVLSTVPLHRAVELAGVEVEGEPDPWTAVLVTNVGGTAGDAVPAAHWVYLPDSTSGVHRYGIYSNVDRGFVPTGSHGTRVAAYVERSLPAGPRPSPAQEARLAREAVDELVRNGVVDDVEVVDTTWVPVAYTWSWPGSTWRERAVAALADVGVDQVGRYGRWQFQGIAESIGEGLAVGRR